MINIWKFQAFIKAQSMHSPGSDSFGVCTVNRRGDLSHFILALPALLSCQLNCFSVYSTGGFIVFSQNCLLLKYADREPNVV